MQKIVLIAGMSGAGLKAATNVFEDVGALCIDNLPAELVGSTVRSLERRVQQPELLVLTVRAHDEAAVGCLLQAFEALRKHHPVELIFLTASDASLVARFRASRRPHPVEVDGSADWIAAIAAERTLMVAVAQAATLTLDSSTWSLGHLRRALAERFSELFVAQALEVELVSFGFKYGVPAESDQVFDARFLRNPYFDPQLRTLTGLADEVQQFVLADARAVELLDLLIRSLQWQLPHIHGDGRRHYVVAVGCTGGQHRSVTLVEQLWTRMHQIDPTYRFAKRHRNLHSVSS